MSLTLPHTQHHARKLIKRQFAIVHHFVLLQEIVHLPFSGLHPEVLKGLIQLQELRLIQPPVVVHVQFIESVSELSLGHEEPTGVDLQLPLGVWLGPVGPAQGLGEQRFGGGHPIAPFPRRDSPHRVGHRVGGHLPGDLHQAPVGEAALAETHVVRVFEGALGQEEGRICRLQPLLLLLHQGLMIIKEVAVVVIGGHEEVRGVGAERQLQQRIGGGDCLFHGEGVGSRLQD
mmetsp:Transcript_111808/g.194063  ORF Transcript_111808/g.194063 Transcript_111808/m.194063 type:complete len:231 (-) Transcript_111808:1524-2216(-)